MKKIKLILIYIIALIIGLSIGRNAYNTGYKDGIIDSIKTINSMSKYLFKKELIKSDSVKQFKKNGGIAHD